MKLVIPSVVALMGNGNGGGNDKTVTLLSITTAPSAPFEKGSKYYNNTTKKIYTATEDNTWADAKVDDPSFSTYYQYNNQTYVWDGNSLELFELEDYQKKLVSGVNIKTINGSSVLGSGNLAVNTYQSFNSNWPTNTTFADFLSAVNSDTTATAGMAYLGELSCSGLPMQGNVEAVVEIQNGPNNNKTIYTVITSGTDLPYRWEYTYWNNGSNVSGWVSFVPQNKEVTITSTTPSLSLEDNTFYNCTNALTSLSVTLPASNMYGIEIHFTTDTGFSGVTFPAGTLYTGTLPTWEANKSYLISIQKNVVIAAEIKTME